MRRTLEAGFEPGLVIRRRRRDAGYSQAQLAAMIGASETAVGRWERNEVEPPSGYLHDRTPLPGAKAAGILARSGAESAA